MTDAHTSSLSQHDTFGPSCCHYVMGALGLSMERPCNKVDDLAPSLETQETLDFNALH